MNDVAQTSFSGLRIDAATKEAGIYFGIPVVKFGAFKGIVLFRVKQEVFSQILAKGISAGSSEQSAIVSADGKVLGVDGNGLVSLNPAIYAFHAQALNTSGMTIAKINRPDGEANAYARAFSFAGEKYLAVESMLRSELNAGSISIAGTLAVIGLCVLAAMCAATAFCTAPVRTAGEAGRADWRSGGRPSRCRDRQSGPQGRDRPHGARAWQFP